MAIPSSNSSGVRRPHAVGGVVPARVHPGGKVVQGEHAGPAGNVGHGEIRAVDQVGAQAVHLASEAPDPPAALHGVARAAAALADWRERRPACGRAGRKPGKTRRRENSGPAPGSARWCTAPGRRSTGPATRLQWPRAWRKLSAHGLAGCRSSSRSRRDSRRCARARPTARWRGTSRWCGPGRSRNP